MRSRTSFGLGLAAAGLTLILAGCASGPSAKAPPAQPLAGGYVDVGLAGQASAFEAFTRRAGAIDAGFSNPSEVAQGLQAGAAYEPRQLEAGMIAYGAMTALQEPGFVAGVKKAGGRELARRLTADPDAALDLPGGQAAASRANAALHRRGEILAEAGQKVRKAAYSVQRQSWSKARVPNAGARLAKVKQIGGSGYRASAEDRARLTTAVTEAGRRGGSSPAAARATAVAALTVLGHDAEARRLMTDPRSASCLRLAKMNYHQCLASAGTHYEDIYCLGVHAMAETGQCVVDATRPARVRRANR